MWLLLSFSSLFWFALAVRPGASKSRRILAGTVALLVPFAGPLIAALVRRARGGGVVMEPPKKPARQRMSSADATRLGEVSPALDRLFTSDAGERLEAMVALSGAGDAMAVEVLRWARDHGPSEVVLDCALTLEELELRSEACLVAARAALAARNCYDTALATGEAAAHLVLNGMADPAVAGTLADEAREAYRRALVCDPSRALEVEPKLAQLELAIGRPLAALAILDRVMRRIGGDQPKLARLRDDAAFAARVFDRVVYLPAPLQMPHTLEAHRLHSVPA